MPFAPKKKIYNNKKKWNRWQKGKRKGQGKTLAERKKEMRKIFRALVLPKIYYKKIYKNFFYTYRLQKWFMKRDLSAPWFLNQWNSFWYSVTSLKTLIKKKNIKKKKKLLRLKSKLKSYLNPKYFQPWKYEILSQTLKQNWLRYQYLQYKKLKLRDRIDFFKTKLGQNMLESTSIYFSSYKQYEQSERSKKKIRESVDRNWNSLFGKEVLYVVI